MLQPVWMCPWVSSSAAPTRNFENGACARSRTASAASIRASATLLNGNRFGRPLHRLSERVEVEWNGDLRGHLHSVPLYLSRLKNPLPHGLHRRRGQQL